MESINGHNKACCNVPPIISKGYVEKGKFEEIGGLKTYVTGPATATKALFVVYDIFGYFPQTLQGADILASSPEGYQVFVPDFFEGKPCDIAWYPPDTPEKQAPLVEWFGPRAPPTAVPKIPKILADIEAVYGKKTWGAVGYCWGSKVLALTSAEGTPWKASASTSPAMLDVEDAAKITIPTCLLGSEEEKKEDIEKWAEGLKGEKYTEHFGDMLHGWMSARGDLEDEKVKAEYEKGYKIFLEWFAKHL